MTVRSLLALAGVVVGLALAPQPAAAAPSIVYDCAPAPVDCSGWYRGDVSVDWTVLPASAVPTGCQDTVLTTDTAGSYQVCSATDGVRVTIELWLKVDKTAPSVAGGTPDRPPDGNGWYRAPVTVAFHGTDATSGIQSCTAPTFSGPESAQAQLAGTCTDVAGNLSAPLGFGLRYDATGPNVTSGKPGRKPDHGRWYRRPVMWRFKGTDALSGMQACPPVVYSGPDGAQARVLGACSDKAGNVTVRSFPLRYDATAPAAPRVTTVPRDGSVKLRIRTAPDVHRITIIRAPGRGGTKDSTLYRGAPRNFTDGRARNGKSYRYTVIASDRAANRSRTAVTAVPGPHLIAPADGATLSAAPLLQWTPIRGADYYNVQLRREGRKMLSRWPTEAGLQLHQRWSFGGRIRRLLPGLYRWDVWPGFGRRQAANYGPRIGGHTFVVPRGWMSAPRG